MNHVQPAAPSRLPPAPPPDVLENYFATLGYGLRHQPDSAFETWVVDRPRAHFKTEVFDDYGVMWVWWIGEALRILNAETEYRLLCSWYRLSPPVERSTLLRLAKFDCEPDHPFAVCLRHCGFVSLGACAQTSRHLDPGWLDAVREIETGFAVSGARSSERFCAFVEAHQRAEERERFAAVMPEAGCPGSQRQRI